MICFYTLIKNVLFSSLIEVGSHNPPCSGPNVLIGTRSSLQLISFLSSIDVGSYKIKVYEGLDILSKKPTRLGNLKMKNGEEE